ncbi:MarR family winged helix-turn-helix transcriptional regulator [Sphingomonas sp. R86520]|uniref:MarR family winged helix-turn-helix transcriptional regulator n=1 Tax=Sphingomonas sp. R86520 TaxID=3093859 RepID=UPI0036D37E70
MATHLIPKAASGEPINVRRALSLKITVAARQMHKSFDQSVAAIGVTRSQWTLIAVISRRPGVTQREVAEILEMSEASVGRLIDRLCSDGMLVRQPKEDDRRAYCVHLTDAAATLLDKISGVAMIHEQAIFAGFEAEDIARFETYLDRITTNIAAMR